MAALFAPIGSDAHGAAGRLAERLGNLGSVFTASPNTLANLAGDAAADLIANARSAMTEILVRRIERRPVIADWQALTDYLHAVMAHRQTESARVLHLNTRNVLIHDELIAEGSIDTATIHVREVARRALELGSAAIILVHNHPSGDPEPSRQDIMLTRDVVAALKPLGIQVHDHLVIASTGHVSMRATGLM